MSSDTLATRKPIDLAKLSSNVPVKYQLAPQLVDVDSQPYTWTPYVMRQAQAYYRSNSLNTDQYGFRLTIKNGEPVNLEDFHTMKGSRGILTGNSTMFGVGASTDTNTVASVLNQLENNQLPCTWFNFSLRASNILQERLTTEIYAPLTIDYMVWVSAINDLIISLLGEGGNQFSPPFIGEPMYIQSLNPHLARMQNLTNPERRYEWLLSIIYKQMFIAAHYRKTHGTKILFCIQPQLSCVDKEMCEEEKLLVSHFDGTANRIHKVHTPAVILKWYERFKIDIQNICVELKLDFINLNTHDLLKTKDWLFIDRIHLTDEGQRRIAIIIREWKQNGKTA